MKKLSLKMKLTLLHTFLMICVAWGVLSLLVTMGKRDLVSGVRLHLEDKVYETQDEIRYDNGKLKFRSEIMNMEHSIYISVYSSDGTFLYGKIPYNFDNTAKFKEDEIRKVQGFNEEFYLLDSIYRIDGYGVVAIRGVASITDAKDEFNILFHFALIVLPLLVVLIGFISYIFTVHTLKPVSRITKTVRSIKKDGDLSRRVHLGEGKDEIYHMAATFDQMLEELEESFKRERQFTSDVAHELRTPVASMMLQCQALLEDKNMDQETREGVEFLYHKTSHLSSMISQLLLLSRADAGRAKVDKEVLDFGELTEMAVEEIRGKAEEKGITVETDLVQNVRIFGDETLMIRFWMNLLNNSICYGKPGGHIKVVLKKSGNKLEGVLEDDGIGISEEALPHIWERFYQEDSSRSSVESSGLGLSMVQWIVAAHEGKIQVKSKKGRGTRFEFSFPMEV